MAALYAGNLISIDEDEALATIEADGSWMDRITYLNDLIRLTGATALKLISNEESMASKMAWATFESHQNIITIPLDGQNLSALNSKGGESAFLDFVERVELLRGETLVFEGYDGLEFGTLSKTIRMSKEFSEIYIEGDMCTVSKDW